MEARPVYPLRSCAPPGAAGTGHALGQQAATDRAYRLLRTLPPEASRFVVGLAGMWCIRAATVPDTFNPSISTWRRARSVALRPLVTRLIADFRDSTRAQSLMQGQAKTP